MAVDLVPHTRTGLGLSLHSQSDNPAEWRHDKAQFWVLVGQSLRYSNTPLTSASNHGGAGESAGGYNVLIIA